MGLSREDLGRMLSVSGRTVSYWETWSKIPDPSRAESLRKALCLSEVDLWRALHPAAEKITVSKRGTRIW